MQWLVIQKPKTKYEGTFRVSITVVTAPNATAAVRKAKEVPEFFSEGTEFKKPEATLVADNMLVTA